MIASTTGIYILPGETEAQSVTGSDARRWRLITPRAGRALEILGHAIEYLADEYVLAAREVSADDPRVEAIQLLMAINREIYFECPVMPTFRERVRAFFRFWACWCCLIYRA